MQHLRKQPVPSYSMDALCQSQHHETRTNVKRFSTWMLYLHDDNVLSCSYTFVIILFFLSVNLTPTFIMQGRCFEMFVSLQLACTHHHWTVLTIITHPVHPSSSNAIYFIIAPFLHSAPLFAANANTISTLFTVLSSRFATPALVNTMVNNSLWYNLSISLIGFRTSLPWRNFYKSTDIPVLRILLTQYPHWPSSVYFAFHLLFQY